MTNIQIRLNIKIKDIILLVDFLLTIIIMQEKIDVVIQMVGKNANVKLMGDGPLFFHYKKLK
jgi:nitrogen regulatory protein PII